MPWGLISMPGKVTHDSHCKKFFSLNLGTATIIYSFAKGKNGYCFFFLKAYLIYNILGIYKVYSLTGFHVWIYLQNHHPNQDNKHIHHSEVSSLPFIIFLSRPFPIISPNSHPCLRATTDLLLSLPIALHFLEFYVGVIMYKLFYARFSHSIILKFTLDYLEIS